MVKKMTPETKTPMAVYHITLVHSPGGSSARGPCGPNAIHHAGEMELSALNFLGESMCKALPAKKCTYPST